MKFRQITPNEWNKGNYEELAGLNIKTSELEQKFPVAFEDSFEDGLGETKLGAFATATGTQFFIEEYLPNSERFITMIGFLNEEETLARDLDEILQVLNLTSKNLTWKDERIIFEPHELWRQDDNGHQFLIETFPCKADAVRAMREFEARLHKQTYWVKKV